MSQPPRPDGRIVVLASFPSRVEADLAAQVLDAAGIQAIVDPGDAGGWMPNVALYSGARVLVFDDDRARAQALLAQSEPPGDAPSG